MFGLVNRAIQNFVEDNYGAPCWDAVARRAALESRDFESMLSYPDEVTERVLLGCEAVLGTERSMILEDLGLYLVTHPNMEPVRRLMRFSGGEFEDFLLSLDELHKRVKVAVSALDMPSIAVRATGPQTFSLYVGAGYPGFGAVLHGMIKAMADDYGALVISDLTMQSAANGVVETLRVELLEPAYSQGRHFDLAAGLRLT